VEQDGIDDFSGLVHKPKRRGMRVTVNRVGGERTNAMIYEWIKDTDQMKCESVFDLSELVLTPSDTRWKGCKELQQDIERSDRVRARMGADIGIDRL
jgi:hypothetical protein